MAEATSTPHLTWTDAPLPSEGLVVMELSESFVVTESGGERLCLVDRELFVVA